MIFGVPIAPLFGAMGVIGLLAFYTQNLFMAVFCIPAYIVMKQMTKQDDFIFRLYFLKMRFFTNPLSKKFHGVKTFQAMNYSKPNNKKRSEERR